MTFGLMTDADKRMSPLHIESDPADIPIPINLEIQIQISDQFWFRFWPWWRFALSEHSLVIVINMFVFNMHIHCVPKAP